jgi:DNA-binding NarL/FixJ family response regulator
MISTENPVENCRAVLVDQHPLFLEGVEHVLGNIGVEVVGKATSPERALELVEEQGPDLLVTEIELEGGPAEGVACVREACHRVHHLKAIAISMLDSPEWVSAAFDAGAEAYVLKTAHPDDLASAIRQVFTQSVYISGSPTPQARPMLDDDLHGLTRREVEILRLVAEGYSNSELAGMLWVTEQTVKFHLSNIYRKLNVANRTEASRWAQLQGLLGQPAVEPDEQSDAGSVSVLRPRHQRFGG